MLNIVFVCTGNRCRSPMAEAFVRLSGLQLPVEVSSVGLLDVGRLGPPRDLLEVLGSFGVDLASHRARPLAGVDLSGADLVIGFEHAHIAAAVVEGNARHETVFLFKEIVRLLETVDTVESEDPVERARLALKSAAEQRESVGFVGKEDMADPFGGSRRVYTDSATQARDLSRRLLLGLFGRSRPGGPTPSSYPAEQTGLASPQAGRSHSGRKPDR